MLSKLDMDLCTSSDFIVGYRYCPPTFWSRAAYKGKTTRLENFIYRKNNFHLRVSGDVGYPVGYPTGFFFFLLELALDIFSAIYLCHKIEQKLVTAGWVIFGSQMVAPRSGARGARARRDSNPDLQLLAERPTARLMCYPLHPVPTRKVFTEIEERKYCQTDVLFFSFLQFPANALVEGCF